jgi:hypothetical protein
MRLIQGHTISPSASLPLRAAAVISMLGLLASLSAWAQMPGLCEMLVSERTGNIGCFVLDNQSLRTLPDSKLFWHLYVFPTREAAKAANAPRHTVIEEFGKIWVVLDRPAGLASLNRRASVRGGAASSLAQ